MSRQKQRQRAERRLRAMWPTGRQRGGPHGRPGRPAPTRSDFKASLLAAAHDRLGEEDEPC